ncbi:hypothetical protein Bbelb_333140 [Branchiostoma belcheri]|nr:hypothetical protein Bbelb_333140 [Branchiostoma belcheri]
MQIRRLQTWARYICHHSNSGDEARRHSPSKNGSERSIGDSGVDWCSKAVQGYHCGARIGECIVKPKTETITIFIAQKTVRTSVENIEKLDIRNPAPHSSPVIHVRIGGSGLVLALKAQRVPNLRDYSTIGLLVSTQCSDLQGPTTHSMQWSPRSPPKKIDTPVILRRMKDLSLFQDISGAGNLETRAGTSLFPARLLFVAEEKADGGHIELGTRLARYVEATVSDKYLCNQQMTTSCNRGLPKTYDSPLAYLRFSSYKKNKTPTDTPLEATAHSFGAQRCSDVGFGVRSGRAADGLQYVSPPVGREGNADSLALGDRNCAPMGNAVLEPPTYRRRSFKRRGEC